MKPRIAVAQIMKPGKLDSKLESRILNTPQCDETPTFPANGEVSSLSQEVLSAQRTE